MSAVWTCTVPVAFPGKFKHRNEDNWWLLQCSSVALRCGRLLKSLLVKKSSLFRLRNQSCLCWRNRSHVISRLQSRNSSSRAARIIVDATTITTVVNSVVWTRALRFALKSVRIGCRRPGKSQEKAIKQKCKREAAAAAKAAKKSQERDAMDDSVEVHAPKDALQLPPAKHKSDGSSKTKRAKTATGSGSKATEADSAGRPSRSREQKKSCVLQHVRGGTAQVRRC